MDGISIIKANIMNSVLLSNVSLQPFNSKLVSNLSKTFTFHVIARITAVKAKAPVEIHIRVWPTVLAIAKIRDLPTLVSGRH